MPRAPGLEAVGYVYHWGVVAGLNLAALVGLVTLVLPPWPQYMPLPSTPVLLSTTTQ